MSAGKRTRLLDAVRTHTNGNGAREECVGLPPPSLRQITSITHSSLQSCSCVTGNVRSDREMDAGIAKLRWGAASELWMSSWRICISHQSCQSDRVVSALFGWSV